VVVTGIGSLSALGRDRHELWDGASQGRLGIAPIRGFDTTDFDVKNGGELPDDDWVNSLPPEIVGRHCRTTGMALYAASQALADAGISATGEPRPIGVYVGSGAGPIYALEEGWGNWFTRGPRGMRPTTVVQTMFNVAASIISVQLKLTGGNQVFAAACASASSAIGHAYHAIVSGIEQSVLAGGYESPLEPAMFAAWYAMRVLSREPDPAKCCRPFDRDRGGLVLAEGAHFLLLEDFESAQRRSAPIVAEILGYGQASDAVHVTAPNVGGQVAAMQRALDDAGLAAADVDYVNAHGTATQANDRVEAESLAAVFGSRRPRISATKSMHGHQLGATGALETILCALACRHDLVPPTIGFATPDPLCDVDVTPNHAVHAKVSVAMNNAFAFGGMNSVVLVGKPRRAG
jgi:3-oxoacyl-[acyl-carrier-protein] synthase II